VNVAIGVDDYLILASNAGAKTLVFAGLMSLSMLATAEKIAAAMI
jgi:hypothetical protein